MPTVHDLLTACALFLAVVFVGAGLTIGHRLALVWLAAFARCVDDLDHAFRWHVYRRVVRWTAHRPLRRAEAAARRPARRRHAQGDDLNNTLS